MDGNVLDVQFGNIMIAASFHVQLDNAYGFTILEAKTSAMEENVLDVHYALRHCFNSFWSTGHIAMFSTKNNAEKITNIAMLAVYPHVRPIGDRYLRPHDLRLSCNETRVTVGQSIYPSYPSAIHSPIFLSRSVHTREGAHSADTNSCTL